MAGSDCPGRHETGSIPLALPISTSYPQSVPQLSSPTLWSCWHTRSQKLLQGACWRSATLDCRYIYRNAKDRLPCSKHEAVANAARRKIQPGKRRRTRRKSRTASENPSPIREKRRKTRRTCANPWLRRGNRNGVPIPRIGPIDHVADIPMQF